MSVLKTMSRGKDFLAETFAGYGITHVFYIESVLRQTLVELNRRGIRGIMAHSEKAAAYMADGYARAGRKPGVCMAQSVGAANLASGLQEAYLAKSPVIALTGRKPTSFRFRNAYQEVEHFPLFEPVTKFNTAIENAAELPQAIRQMFREAVTGTPGPVHADMPNHQAAVVESGEVTEKAVIEKRFSSVPPFRPAPDSRDVLAAVELIYASERPLIVGGGGASWSQAGTEIQRLVEGLNVPFASSVDGKGLLLEDHPLNLGIMGGYGRACANAIAAEADLVVFIGCSACDQTTKNWTLPGPDVRIVQVDINPAELGRNYPNAVSILGDAKVSAAAMADALRGPHANGAWTRKATDAVTGWKEALRDIRNSKDSPIKGERLCQIMQDVLPDNGVLVVDTGFASIWAGCQIGLTKPGQRFIRAAGGSLGWSFPASLGVQCALPGTPVICFTGDGGFWYHLAEIETAVRYNIPSVTVVYNNNGLGMCYQQLASIYKDGSVDIGPMYRFGTGAFAQTAKAMGANAYHVEREDQVAGAVTSALASGKPSLVEVITDITSDPQKY